MTDLEMTRLCAEAMGLRSKRFQLSPDRHYVLVDDFPGVIEYRPLTNGAQALALAEKMRLGISPPDARDECWMIGYSVARNKDLKRAIVEASALEWKRMKKAP